MIDELDLFDSESASIAKSDRASPGDRTPRVGTALPFEGAPGSPSLLFQSKENLFQEEGLFPGRAEEGGCSIFDEADQFHLVESEAAGADQPSPFDCFEDISETRESPSVAPCPVGRAQLEPRSRQAKPRRPEKSRIKKKRLNKQNLSEMEREFIRDFDYREYIRRELEGEGGLTRRRDSPFEARAEESRRQNPQPSLRQAQPHSAEAPSEDARDGSGLSARASQSSRRREPHSPTQKRGPRAALGRGQAGKVGGGGR